MKPMVHAQDLRSGDVLILGGVAGQIVAMGNLPGFRLGFKFSDGTHSIVGRHVFCDRKDIEVYRNGVKVWPRK